jgi:hypothetical protein
LAVAHDADGALGGDLSVGDAVTMYNATTAQRLGLRIGTAAAPDAVVQPTVKVERTMQVASSGFSGDGVEPCSAIIGIGSGTATNDGQVVGVAGLAKSASTTVTSTGGDDACGLYGAGRITGSGTGTGMGAFFNGRRDTDTGRALGLEVACDNQTATAESYLSTGFTDCAGIWLRANGTARAGVGLAIGNPANVQFDVGIGFTSQGTGGPVLTNSIRVDDSSTTSILINGTHSVAAFAVASATANNGVLIGGVTSLSTGAARLEVQGSSTFQDPLVYIGSTSQNQAYKVLLRNSSGTGFWGVSAATDGFLTGTVAGDLVLTAGSTGKALHLGGTVSTVEVTRDNKLGFYNATTPVAQQTGVAVNATAIHAALVSLGLITA